MKPETLTNDDIKYMEKKWIPVLHQRIDEYIKFIHPIPVKLTFMSLLSIYCDWYSKSNKEDLKLQIDLILKKFLESSELVTNHKSEIFNQILDFQQTEEIFGIEFTKENYPSLYRDEQINKIIN